MMRTVLAITVTKDS